MYLRIISLLCAFAYGISRISGPNFKAINFAEKIKGQKLKRSLIRDGEVVSESSCQLECVNEERCQSYNFGIIASDSKKFKCQLSDSDRFDGFANFIEDKSFIYRGIKVRKICHFMFNRGGVSWKSWLTLNYLSSHFLLLSPWRKLLCPTL